MKIHQYNTSTVWTGNRGEGTSSYTAYSRDHEISADHKTSILCSSDPAFRGDKTRYNPEELLVASLSACHMLWYLHLCAEAGVVVVDYKDEAYGEMPEGKNGLAQFSVVILRPRVVVTDASMVEKAQSLHHKANQLCFIAKSVNFPVQHEGEVLVS